MIRMPVFFLFALLLVVFQMTVPDIFFSGRIGVELSLVLVIYAGFYLSFAGGAVFSFLLGFVLDCLTGTISGLFTLSYSVTFVIAALFSLRMYAEKFPFIALFTFVAAIAEGILIISFYRLIYGLNILSDIVTVFLPQALVLGLLSPVCFRIFQRMEVLLNAGHAESVEQP